MNPDLEKHKLTCSSCGGELVRVFVREASVTTECATCSSTSELVVVVQPPKIEFRFSEGSSGRLMK